MPTLFDSEISKTKGKRVLRSKLEWIADIRTLQGHMFLDITSNKSLFSKNLGSYMDALSRLDSGITRMEATRTKIIHEECQHHLKVIQDLKQHGFGEF